MTYHVASYDARNTKVQEGVHWSDMEHLGDRGYFEVNTNPATLRIKNVTKEEAGVYRCRLDFKSSPTQNILVNLTVIGKLDNEIKVGQ